MTRRTCRAPTAAVFLLLGIAWGCDGPETAREDGGVPGPTTDAFDAGTDFPLTLEDHAGRRVRLEEEPRRVISLVPAITRILIALDGVDRLVARTDFDQDPALADLPSVGGGLEPSMERLVSLEPDLVIRFDAPSDPDTPRRLDAAGILHLAVRPDGIEDVMRMIDLVGRAVGASRPAAALRRQVAAELQDVRDRVSGVARPRIAYLLGGDPPLVAGGNTFLHELVNLAGADNVFSNRVDLYAPISVEEVLDREIDLLLVTERASVPTVLQQLPTIRVPPEVEVPGPHVGASARRLGRELHPDRFR